MPQGIKSEAGALGWIFGQMDRVGEELATERLRIKQLIEAVEFEIGCMRTYAEEKPGPMGKLAGEIADPLEAAVDAALRSTLLATESRKEASDSQVGEAR